MGVNKVELSNGETIVDLTSDTVTPETLAEGETAHDAQGEPIVGTMPVGGGSVEPITIGDKEWNGSEAVDFTDTINNMIDEKVENLDSDNGVVWLEGTLSMATMTVTSLSFTYQQIVDLLSQNKLIKFKGNHEQGVVIGDIVAHNTFDKLLVIQAMLQANYGDGLKLYYFSITINSNDRISVNPFIVNTTSIGG